MEESVEIQPEIYIAIASGPPSNADTKDINLLQKRLIKTGLPKMIWGATLAISIRESTVFIARDRNRRDDNPFGTIVGMVCLSICKPPSRWYGMVDDVVVSGEKEYIHKGIGTKLMNTAIAFAKENGLEEINLKSHPDRGPANAMYLKLGFKLIIKGDAAKGISNYYQLSLVEKPTTEEKNQTPKE